MSTSLFKPIAQTLVVLALFAAAPSIRAADDAIQLGVSGRASAFPSLAASGRFVVLVWGATTQDGVTDVYAATSRDGGKTFSASVGVNQPIRMTSTTPASPPHSMMPWASVARA